MPRRARLSLPGIPWHVIQRGNNRAVCFMPKRITGATWTNWLNSPGASAAKSTPMC